MNAQTVAKPDPSEIKKVQLCQVIDLNATLAPSHPRALKDLGLSLAKTKGLKSKTYCASELPTLLEKLLISEEERTADGGLGVFGHGPPFADYLITVEAFLADSVDWLVVSSVAPSTGGSMIMEDWQLRLEKLEKWLMSPAKSASGRWEHFSHARVGDRKDPLGYVTFEASIS
ncbi:hypothetical protein HYALB_00003957 [Hymenoscyphus albidus]|uniref:Uncharacterized protein n=1 Tax=Hymenoscyphus albidus TaxID=595503 RepID=A0A9N9LTE0_9HELO|nr:hypothetical protein HYALB_00003957 [Hymenoscyphus albidus]